MSRAEHVADLVSTMWLLVLMDLGHVYVLHVHSQTGEGIPSILIMVVISGFFYEAYVLHIARRALQARRRKSPAESKYD